MTFDTNVGGTVNVFEAVRQTPSVKVLVNITETPSPREMKRTELIKHMKRHDAVLVREGRRHSIYQKGEYKTQVPRHNEVVDELARKICKDLNIPFVR